MPLPSSGAITLNDIHVEAGGSTGNVGSLNDSDIRALVGIPSGAISFSDFYTQYVTIGSNVGNLSVGTYALANGWDGDSRLVFTITGEIRGSTQNNSTAAVTVSGTYPKGVVLINNGTIIGRGGAGGAGGRCGRRTTT